LGGSPAQGVRKNHNAADENFRQQHPLAKFFVLFTTFLFFGAGRASLRKRGLH